MKVTKLSLKMLLDSMKALDKVQEEAEAKADAWLAFQKDREYGWNPDPYSVSLARDRLERALEDYRDQLAHTYDLMGDKGLVNFMPTGEYVDDGQV